MVLYDYLCQNIVGTVEHVKGIRMTNVVRHNLQSDNITTVITSGSFGEGLDMQCSDVDVVQVMKGVEVCEDQNITINADEIYLTIKKRYKARFY